MSTFWTIYFVCAVLVSGLLLFINWILERGEMATRQAEVHRRLVRLAILPTAAVIERYKWRYLKRHR